MQYHTCTRVELALNHDSEEEVWRCCTYGDTYLNGFGVQSWQKKRSESQAGIVGLFVKSFEQCWVCGFPCLSCVFWEWVDCGTASRHLESTGGGGSNK